MNTLRKALIDYLAMRRNLGFKLAEAGRGLLAFVSFLGQKKQTYITVHLALEWAQLPVSAQPAHWSRRLRWVRIFARYCSTIDLRTEVPPLELLPFKVKRIQPYLYTDKEVRQLLEAALNLPQVSELNALRRQTYYCLLGLLVVTGLRISEALNLKVEDIDFKEGLLVIREAKLGKSRLVPLHASTLQVLSDYLLHRAQFLKRHTATYLFISNRGNRLDGAQVHRTFYFLSRQIGLRGQESSRGPRLHDFRHRLAVQTLLNWYRNGEQVEHRLPVLSTYLGHVHVSDTYWYLTACPELMEEAVKRLEQRWEVKP
jgi:integrase/recombinase XerD